MREMRIRKIDTAICEDCELINTNKPEFSWASLINIGFEMILVENRFILIRNTRLSS